MPLILCQDIYINRLLFNTFSLDDAER